MSEQPTDLTVVREAPPALAGFATASPALTLARGKAVADAAAPVIRELNLVKRIHQSFHVYFDGWTMVGAMVGVFPVTVRTWEIGTDEGYGANVEARTLGGQVVGAADAIVMRDEEVGGKQKWLEAPAFQIASMAQTRGGGKALRQPLGWIMRLAGYEATPAEEMDEGAAARGETVSGGKGVAPGWADLAEQQRAFADFAEEVAKAGLREWVATWIASKGYSRPLAKGQFRQLQRALERERKENQLDERLRERKEESSRPASDDDAPGRPAGATSAAGGDGPPATPAADPTSPPAQTAPGKGDKAGGDDPQGSEIT